MIEEGGRRKREMRRNIGKNGGRLEEWGYRKRRTWKHRNERNLEEGDGQTGGGAREW